MRKLTQEEFIAKAVAVHGAGRYDYSQTAYLPMPQKIKIICPDHGAFEQKASAHLSGHGCKKCGFVERETPPQKSFADFLARARAAHGDKYGYGLVAYKDVKTKVQILCPEHGVFEQTPDAHKRGHGCDKCGGSSSLNTQSFITRAHEIHGYKYNYAQVEYVTARAKIIIICPEHGPFEQVPHSHLTGNGCTFCSRGPGSVSTSSFIALAKATHGDKFDYSRVKYVASESKIIIICPDHGPFEQIASAHLKGAFGCYKCGRDFTGQSARLDTGGFIKRAQAVHGTRYDYSQVEYVVVKKKVRIICLAHGAFYQTPDSHMSGKGCRRCRDKKLEEVRLLSWVQRAKGRMCTLYFLRLFDESEEFYKVGVTTSSVGKRFAGPRTLCYQYEVLALHKSANATAVFEWEQSILETFAHLHYKPKRKFGGETECFSSCEEILAIFPL